MWLAIRTPAGGSAAYGSAVESGAATRAFAAGFPTVGKQPGDGVGPVVADDADGGAADPAYFSPESARVGGVERSRRGGGMEMGAPEDFVGHPIADAGEMFLHKQHGFERSAASALQEPCGGGEGEFG